MVATSVQQVTSAAEPTWHAAFLQMLPKIRRTAECAFRKVHPELRDELIQEVVANAVVTYSRLVELGKQHRGFPSALGRFGVYQTRAGRRVGNRLHGRDVMSDYARRRLGFHVNRLDLFSDEDETWQEIVVEDSRASPAEIAACRLDFSDWLGRLPRLRRKMALALASGETTADAAKKFGVSASRISQIRNRIRCITCFHFTSPWLRRSDRIFLNCDIT
jgi:hypothetical protein